MPVIAAPVAGDPGEVRADALVNAYSGLGDVTRDRRVLGSFRRRSGLSQATLDALWMDDGIAARLVERKPAEMFRAGFKIEHNAKPGSEQYVVDRLTELQAVQKITEAMCYQRAYGGGVVVMGLVDSSADPRLPVNDDTVQRVAWLDAADRWRVRPSSGSDAYDRDVRSATHGQVAVYTVDARSSASRMAAASQVDVHASRMLVFDGFAIPPRIRDERDGWGGSRLERAHDPIRNWRTVADGLASMATDLSTWVWKVPGLLEIMRQNRREVVVNMLRERELLRGVVNAQVCDPANGGGVEAASRQLAGVGELANTAMRDLASAVDEPLAILFGSQGSGLAQSHETDLVLWESGIVASQEHDLRPALERLISLILHEPGAPDLGDDWRLVFAPLRTPTAKEAADTDLVVAQRHQIYVTMGAPAEWAIRAAYAPVGSAASTPVTPEEMARFLAAVAVDVADEDAERAAKSQTEDDANENKGETP